MGNFDDFLSDKNGRCELGLPFQFDHYRIKCRMETSIILAALPLHQIEDTLKRSVGRLLCKLGFDAGPECIGGFWCCKILGFQAIHTKNNTTKSRG